MYVAVTRPKQNLLLTGSYWKPGNKNSRKPSSFLISACELLNVELNPLQSDLNPIEVSQQTQVWPLDPLGERHRIDLERAAKQTRKAIDAIGSSDRESRIEAIIDSDKIHHDIDLLLAEREAELKSLDDVRLPVRIPASSFKDFIGDYEAITSRLRRPMPQPPYKQTRAGTLFHSWVEQHYGTRSLLEGADSEDAQNQDLAEQNIQHLKDNFSSSRFAKMTPIDVEREIQLTVGGNTFICKLDAVFESEGGVLIVDWKTGKAPKDAEDEKLKTMQLALYRLAYSEFTGMPIEKIQVCFYFVADNVELIPKSVPSGEELMKLWSKVS
jgi:DNA helicase-2/ATP-dependent DNA helicase PcrA